MNNTWKYSTIYKSTCKVVDEQTLWGQTVCRVWLTGSDSVVCIPAVLYVYADGGGNEMSGGHFEYQESYLGYIAEQLEKDIEYNDVEYDIAKSADAPYGFQHQPETIEFMKNMVKELYKLEELLREYDLAVSGDTRKQNFLEKARSVYRSSEVKTC